MLIQTREYRPIAAFAQASAVKFQVSPTLLHVDIGQPYTKLAAPLSQVSFAEAKMGFERIQVVNVVGGNSSELFWQISLTPEDAADLKALIAEVREAARRL